MKSDGTYAPFEMKGGTFAGWVSELNDITCQMDKCRDSLLKMELSDIDGTAIAGAALGFFYDKVHHLLERMESYEK